jgi:cytidylate kinase
VIAIDGPSGAGKSTIAKKVAEALGFDYLDTGALYRATALGLRDAGLDEGSTDAEVFAALRHMDVEFIGGRTMLKGRDVSEEIRTPEAGHYSSVFSARKPVRDFLLPVQQKAAREFDLVAEGRDMGTIVFPDAWIKIFLVASVEARAKRRHLQLLGSASPVSSEEARRDVVERDARDSSRDLAPLARAADALEIDNSELSINEVLERIMQEVPRA